MKFCVVSTEVHRIDMLSIKTCKHTHAKITLKIHILLYSLINVKIGGYIKYGVEYLVYVHHHPARWTSTGLAIYISVLIHLVVTIFGWVGKSISDNIITIV